MVARLLTNVRNLNRGLMSDFNIKKFFTSQFGEDGILLEIDWNQLEICALAEITGDSVLIAELNSGVDIHRANAAAWLLKKPEDVAKEERRSAKTMTFMLQYGASAKKIAETLNIPRGGAQSFQEVYRSKYADVADWHDNLKTIKTDHMKSCGEKPFGLVWTSPITGRSLSYSPKIPPDGKPWYISSTEMMNYPPQSLATGDMVPIVLNMLMERLFRAKLIPLCEFTNTVHDSYTFDVHSDYFFQFLVCVERTFEDFPAKFKELFDYNLKVLYNYSIKYGKNLLEQKELSRIVVCDILDNL
jgi:DNA polymerase family A